MLATEVAHADTAILYALPDELAALRQELRIVGEPVRIADRQVHIGYRKGEKVVLAQSGSGQIPAAITTQAVLGRFKVDRLICIGPAGNLRDDWKVGDILIASDIVHYEAGSEKASGFIVKEPPRLRPDFVTECEKLRTLALGIAAGMPLTHTELKPESREPKAAVRQGRIASGDKFIATSAKRAWLRETFGADAVDMMSAAIARTCEANGVPYVIIRVLSDNADESASEDFARFIESPAASVTAAMALRLLAGFSPPPETR
jgi:5'-methylthioadenosine/S-adenosylhomocysteine nucleosidase